MVEVLAALLIFSLAIVGLTRSGTESVRAISILEHKTYAGIVADNQLILARIGPLKTGTESGQEDMAGRVYQWRREVVETESSGFYNITVDVNKSNDPQILITRIAFRIQVGT